MNPNKIGIENPQFPADKKGLSGSDNRSRTTVIDFRTGRPERENDGKNCLNCALRVLADDEDGPMPPECIECTRSGLACGVKDNWTDNGEEPDLTQSSDDAPPVKRNFGDNVKWIKEEKITVSQPLSEAEKALYAEKMAALDKEIEELENERAAISSSLKKQIDAKEQERREMSAHVNDGELRTFTCDCLKDYATGEMVWTEAYPPYSEVQRRKMTEEEMRPSLLEFQEKNG